MTYIDDVIRKICNREGGYTNDPLDPGGPTKYGITQSTLSRWRKKVVTATDVKNLTLEEASKIYKSFFVEAPGYLYLEDDPLAEQLIDAGVNHGPEKSIRMLQQVVGTTVDGRIGPKTKTKYLQMKPEKVFSKFMGARIKYYSEILLNKPSQVKYAGGWLNRCAEMCEIYVAAVNIDINFEGRILQIAKLARTESLRIQSSSAVRKTSAAIFLEISKKMNQV